MPSNRRSGAPDKAFATGGDGQAAHWEQMNTVLPLLNDTGLPPGSPGPDRLPDSAREGLATTPFGLYVHVPFCATRCGYCDFNTYTSDELGPGANRSEYAGTAIAELELAARTLGPDLPTVSTVFVGGGTPTLLPADDLVAVLAGVRELFPVAPGVEVTTEANPETVSPASLSRLREGGFTRVSLGMQSAAPHVLAALDRRHTPGRAVEAAHEARAAGFEHVNLDLIYGTPGESDADWAASLDAVLASPVDHVSAYALIVEEGTRLARRVRRGELPMPDDDVLADRYEQADATLRTAGFEWYEVSNWATSDAARCRHNELYWANANWWGVGPGAHSHVGGLRWWNVKHPAAYADRLALGQSPAQDAELLDEIDRALEAVMLGLRLRDGLPLTALTDTGRSRAAGAVADGLLDAAAHAAGRAVLTDRGRLLADAVVRDLTD
ncbi:anaerobic coproporphyrinogen III oxidase [Blastococcus saxobsidens]|uniref:Heme chaperone HemW n=2 Tax=Blastococcus saxobsidens TaxID=138336 RepID=A0A4Q7Y4G1_9ACTN|nr:anaerobic coproporphyrinogen III oxidase [Blastococcus saxobsidens]